MKWKEKGEALLKSGDAREAYRAYAEAIYLTEKRNVGKALNDIDAWIEEIYENPEYDRESLGVMELIRNLYLHKAKIYGRIDHYTESQKALALAGYEYTGAGISSKILRYIEEIEKRRNDTNLREKE
ncbi:hypothetical protein [Acetivibrio ethanolgignens]|uniref:Uncharacterized protein n=1 Tax=Acetivibrio ethanolgignens TaxID=290052 RepID=A0A0V8QAF6_9FIRM|nr:hypothetical protein [Acetivibrio ethanolgignens]KSV57553.1 hypothetical protein ASU35_16015 [Acetivibrio ethanolgignens]